MKHILLFLSLVFIVSVNQTSQAQIYEPEGLNMPGEWDNWENPPSNPVLAGIQADGNLLSTNNLGTNHYQTIFSTPDDIASGTYEFLFTSGPEGDVWANKWNNVNVELNTIQTYTFTGTVNNSITLDDNKYYVMNWENIGYEDTRAIFMEMNSAPAKILSTEQDWSSPQPETEVTISIETDKEASGYFYLRYTTDAWSSSEVIAFNFVGTSGEAIIPGFTSGTGVEYYIFSTVFDDLSGFSGSDFDLITINYDNKSGSNYSYTVAEALTCENASGVITAEPVFPLHNGPINITFDASLGNGALMNYSGDIYIHTGLITSESEGNNDWQYVVSEWGVNEPEFKFTAIGENLYEWAVSDIRQFYGVPEGEEIQKIAMVIRSDEPISPEEPNNFLVARNSDDSDIHINVYNQGLNVKYVGSLNKDPLVDSNTSIPVCIYATDASTISIGIDGIEQNSADALHLMHVLNTADYDPGLHEIVASATDGTDFVYDTAYFYIRNDVTVEALPEGMEYGINYIDDNTVTLVFHEPSLAKEFAFVIGDFNNWTVSEEAYMKRTPDGTIFWTNITGLNPGTEYAYQYYIDGELKLADPYSDKILDPWNDRYIPENNYPNLKEYPWDKTTGIVSVLETGQTPYSWSVTDFVPAAVNETQPDLIIYELLIRDFVESQAIKDVTDSLDYLKNLGVNAIELMPISEFDGNDSWGYAPNFFYAPDKAYGTKNDYKQFIDECHKKGIAVILDVVYNHQFGGSPFVQLYRDEENEQPAANNAWFNQQATHPYSVGYDLNHESTHTRELVKDNLEYWMTEYNIDGFRFDLSKGFTQNNTGDDINAWSQYDQSRIDILLDYKNHVKSINPIAYVILEHFAVNDEELVLANEGCLMWADMSTEFGQNTMGWEENHNFAAAYYANRDFTYPNLIPYMESHDEERIMYKNLEYGNSITGDTIASLKKTEAAAVMYMSIPGPKMLWQFGEIGYDESIYLCSDESFSDDCRTSAKPVHWEYTEDINRQKLYKIYATMAKLKTEQTAFREGVYSQDLNGMGKRMWISHNDGNFAVSANFSATSFDMTPGFQHTGTWYNYFTGESFEVTNTAEHSFEYEPGDYYVFTNQPLDKPLINLSFTVQNSEGTAVENAEVCIRGFTCMATNSEGSAQFIFESNSTVEYSATAEGYQTKSASINLSTEDHNETIALDEAVSTEYTQPKVFAVYPNPGNGELFVELLENGNIQISDISGRIVLQKNLQKGKNALNLSFLKPGIYLIDFTSKKSSFVKKIIIQ
jgi:1,4-alpha-glucan branching enzyme